LLHEAVLDRRISELALDRMLVSYHSVATHRMHHDMYQSVIPGVLKAYDLPDLVAAVAPRPVWLVDAVDSLGRVLPAEQTKGQYARSFEAFRALGADAAIQVLTERPEQRARVFE
jgi:hypothetical protein